jgi:hypothetical protein
VDASEFRFCVWRVKIQYKLSGGSKISFKGTSCENTNFINDFIILFRTTFYIFAKK